MACSHLATYTHTLSPSLPLSPSLSIYIYLSPLAPPRPSSPLSGHFMLTRCWLGACHQSDAAHVSRPPGPVNKMINMLSVFVREGKDSEQFRNHVERLPDYFWMVGCGGPGAGFERPSSHRTDAPSSCCSGVTGAWCAHGVWCGGRGGAP